MDIVYSSLNLKKNLNFESLINKFLEIKNNIDVKLLSFLRFSLNIDLRIKVDDVKNGFYKIKALGIDEKSVIIEFNTKAMIDNIQNTNRL